MIGGIYFAGAPFAGVLKAAGAAAAALAGAASITVSSLGTLDPPPQYLTGTAAITVTTAATMDNPPAYLAGDATIIWTTDGTMDRPPAVDLGAGIWIDGVEVTGRVRVAGVTIHDILNDAPNTARFTIEGDAPAVGQQVRILTGDVLLFTGSVQTVDQTYELQPKHLAWDIAAIDDTAEANARRPFGTFFAISATTIAQTITTQFAPGFSTAGIAAGLPPVTIMFDGADLFIGCLTRLATAIGGYCKIFDHTVYLFLDDLDEPPDPLDDDHPFLDAPPFSVNTDSSQLRTRVYGKGYGENVPADINAGETLMPITNGALFPVLGGTAIAGLTPDGAQSERIAFAGVVLGSGGSLVGTGSSPTTAPILELQGGAGTTPGLHTVSVAYRTAAGQSLAGPPATITTGVHAPPATAPLANPPTAGAGPDTGSHDYAASFVTAYGETVAGAISNAVTTTANAGQLPPPGMIESVGDIRLAGAMESERYHYYRVTFLDANGETTLGVFAYTFIPSGFGSVNLRDIPLGPAGTTGRRIYRMPDTDIYANYRQVTTLSNNVATEYLDAAATGSLGGPPPVSNTTGAAVQRIPVTNIPLGPAGVTARKLYRRFNGAGTFKLVTTLANNTTTTFTDNVSNAALGAASLGTATAIGNQIAVKLPIGASAVTARELYFSPVGGSPRRLLWTYPDNTTVDALILSPDASLTGALEPTADSSGLQQPSGQVNPGAPILPVASSAPFRPTGGWVTLGGGQVVKHTGISGNTLIGIPATGSGAITTAVIYGQQAIPAPMLVGVTGLTKPMLTGSAVHLWVQRDDLLAQAEHAARAGGAGVVEFLIVDQRRGVDSLVARCDADLALFSRPIVTVGYATRDLKTKSGKPIVIDLPSQRMQATLIIQDVTITKIDIIPGLAPVFTVKASSVRFSLEDTLRRLIAGGQTEVNA